MASNLTAVAVAAAAPATSRREIPDERVRGLRLIVQPSGSKSWALRYERDGKARKLTIGKWPEVDLAAARRVAMRAKGAIAAGGDPASEKTAARASEKSKRAEEQYTFTRAVDLFLEQHVRPRRRPSTSKEYERALKREAIPHWGNKPIGSIRRADVRTRLNEMVARDAPIAANRFLAIIRKLFNFAIERDLVSDNPCKGISAPAEKISRDRILTDGELREVWQAAGWLAWPFGPAVRLLILTGQRRGEIVGMRWAELDLDAETWVVPRERAKNNVAHTVPLSAAAVAILRDLPRIGERPSLVFSTTSATPVSGHSKAKRRLDGLIEKQRKKNDAETSPMPHWTIHDLRRTVASGMARLGIALPVIEKVLNHTSGSFGGIVGVYQRHSFEDEKRSALNTWAAHVKRVTGSQCGKPLDDVAS